MRHSFVIGGLCLALAGALAGCGGGGGGDSPPPQPLVVTLAGAGTGGVASAPAGIACGADCAESYASGSEVSLTATPAPGSVFSGWTGACTGTGPCSVKLDAARTVGASFARAQYQLGGQVSGLTTAGLGLKSGPDRLSLAAGAGTFSFGAILTSGMAYEVVIERQPQDLLCTVVNGKGSAGFGDVSTPSVTCGPAASGSWRAGTTTHGAPTVFGTQGQATPGATPGARYGVLRWHAADGIVWLYGGLGGDSGRADLWTFDTRTGLWTWRSGLDAGLLPNGDSESTDPPSPEQPGARAGSGTWVTPSGGLWLFGGQSIQRIKRPLNGFGNVEFSRNDLWRLDPATATWTWMGGPLENDDPGRFEVKGVASATAVPPARTAMATWVDDAGNLWLFGGRSAGALVSVGTWNDLWKYSPATQQWTWVAGANVSRAAGNYGTLGTAADGIGPGARYAAASWRDRQGRLCVYGGRGLDATGVEGALADLWCFDIPSGRWAWLAGPSLAGAPASFGERGIDAAGNEPGARAAPLVWRDRADRVWLYGGQVVDAQGQHGLMADLWRLDPSTLRWTWIAGPREFGVASRPGEQAVPAAGNWPGGRQSAATWTDPEGALWLFGGGGIDSATGISYVELNDVWKLTLAP